MNEPTSPSTITNDAAATADLEAGAPQVATSTQPLADRTVPKQPRASRRTTGSGAMGPRMSDESSTPLREELDRAATRAQTTGHRFDLMRYLRLRRRQTRR